MAKISPGTGLDEKQKAKIVGFRKRWKKTVDEAKGENLQIAGRKKDAIDSIVEEAERMGIPPRAFRLTMKRFDHQDKAEGVREQITDEEILDAFDKMGLALEPELDLGGAEQRKPRKKKAEEADPAAAEPAGDGDERSNVAQLRSGTMN